MYAAGKAPLRAVVGANSAGSEAELVCYRTLVSCVRRAKIAKLSAILAAKGAARFIIIDCQRLRRGFAPGA